MAFLIVCIDKENPSRSEIVPVEETDEQMKNPIPTHLDCLLFLTKENAEDWVFEDELEFPHAYDYHIIQV